MVGYIDRYHNENKTGGRDITDKDRLSRINLNLDYTDYTAAHKFSNNHMEALARYNY